MAAPPGWRFRVGLGLFALGLFCPVFIPLVAVTRLPTTWKATLSGLLALGLPELLWLAAAAVLGTQGFEVLKSRLFALFKRVAAPREVGPWRHRVGVTLFLVPFLYGWLSPYLEELAPRMGNYRLGLALGGDLLVLVALVVLGGEFWEKLGQLFVRGRVRSQGG